MFVTVHYAHQSTQTSWLTRAASIAGVRTAACGFVLTANGSFAMSILQIWERSLMKSELEGMVRSFDGLATVQVRQGNSIISLVANVASSSAILKR